MTAPTKEEKRAETKLEGDIQRVVSKEGRSGCEARRDGRGWRFGVGLVRARDWDEGQGQGQRQGQAQAQGWKSAQTHPSVTPAR